jgi:hypothetical protein
MIAVITGDIINSRLAASPESYLSILKKEFSEAGKEGKDWDIFRGDSFQLKVLAPEESLKEAIQVKAAIRTIPALDVKIAIGIGDISFDADNISESSGKAFLRSGELLKNLDEEKITMGIATPLEQTDRELNLMIKLALTFMDRWTERMAETVFYSLKNENMTQTQLGEILKVRQNTVSELQRRAYFTQTKELISYYKNRIKNAFTD